jgi:hypothetical protein
VLLFQQLRQVISSTPFFTALGDLRKRVSPVIGDADGRSDNGVSIVLAPSSPWCRLIEDPYGGIVAGPVPFSYLGTDLVPDYVSFGKSQIEFVLVQNLSS